MAYIGNDVPANFQSLPAVVRFNGNGSTLEFALGRTISNVQSIIVSVDGVAVSYTHLTLPTKRIV